MHKPLLLLVDDDRAVKNLLSETLYTEGFQVLTAGNGIDALKLIGENTFDLILLDIMMPGMDGLEVCKRIRDQYPGPIVLISGRDRNADKVIGLSVGADDYITKPFEIDEVVSRVKAHLRREQRTRTVKKSTDTVLSFDDGALVIHKDSYEIYMNQERMDVSTKEFQILSFLAEHEGRIVSREQIYESIWGEQDSGDIHTVTVHIKNLRAKIDTQNRYIKTVWGSGYKFTGEKD
jgi:DNA-binding response OmpR family regulator